MRACSGQYRRLRGIGRVDMRTFWKGIITLVAALTLIAALQPLYAQTPSVTAEVDRTDPTLYDTVTLTITVTGESNIGAPDLPSLSGLQVVGRNISSEQTILNGQLSARFEFVYNLQPRHTGTIEIGPVRVTVGDDIHETAPITLDVTRGVAPTPLPIPTPSSPPISSFLRPQSPSTSGGDPSFPSSADDGSYFFEAEVDKDSPYMGEQISYISKFYSSNPYMTRPVSRSPDFAGFWNPGRTNRREYPEVVSGVGYSVIESSAMLFPTLAGNISIEPSSVSIFSGGLREHASPPIELQVRPLPMNEPPSFTGAVGKYNIEASVNENSVELGESLTLTVIISGAGNFDTLPDPTWQDIPGWRAFENNSSYSVFVEDGILNGIKTFQRILVPNEPGSFDIPPIEYSYFDPSLEQYITASTDAISVRVAPDPSAAAVPDPSIEGDGVSPEPDIRHIKPAPGGIGAPSDSILAHPIFWGLGGLPIAALAALAAWRWAGARREAMARANASAKTRELALKRLSDLASGGSDADAATATAALHGYLSVILGRASSALLAPELNSILGERGIKPDTISRLESILRDLDQTRFAPHGLAQAGDEGKAVAEIVGRIERELHP